MNLQDIATRLETVSNIAIVDDLTRTAAKEAALIIRQVDKAYWPGGYVSSVGSADVSATVQAAREGRF